MSRVNVNYNEKQSISDIFTLTNVVTDESVALIPSDSEGNFSWSGITKAPLARNAMQTTTSSGEWSDLEYPWQAIQQEDWGGGRANLRFSSDKSRFYDSKRAQSAFNSVIYNAPLEYYSDGLYRALATNCPGSVTWQKVVGSKSNIAVTFECGSITTPGELYIHLRRRGTPENPLVVSLCSGSVTERTVLATHSYTTDEITDTVAEFPKFTFSDVTLTEGETYIIYINSEDGDSDDYWEIGSNVDADSSVSAISEDDETWVSVTWEPYYRLAQEQGDYRCKFFTYEQLQFAVRQQGEDGTPKIRLIGEIGKATSGSTTSLSDTSKSWETDQWAGARIGIVYGEGAQEHVSCWRTIESNTETVITVSDAFDIQPEADCIYIINNTPLWQYVSGHGLTSHVTDICVVNGVVYFAQGDYTVARKMRFNHLTGSFEFAAVTNTYATFLESVRDTSAMMLYRARNDGINNLRTVERSILLDWASSETSWTTVSTALTTVEPSPTVTTVTATTTDTDDGTDTTKDVDQTTTTTIAGTNTAKETVDRDIDVTVTTSGSTTTTTTTETTTTTQETLGRYVLRTSIVTASKDFSSCDYDFRQYVITIGNFSSDNYTGACVITLQESEDNSAFSNVQSITATGAGTWRLFAHCSQRYRRFQITATGTNCTVNDIAITTSSAPHWEDPIILQDNYGKITRIFEYGSEQEKSLWVFQEGMVSSINKTNSTYHLDRINVDELWTTADEHNGKAVGTSDVYLLFGWINGLQRYYNTQLEGKGPDHDEGLPESMRGRVTQILSYPSNFFVSIDAGDDGYSTVLMFNGNGWHNIYTAPNKGERIHDIAFQPIYGDIPDRLWINVGDDIIWLVMPSKVLYALHDPYAEYTHESVIVSAWITGGMAEVDKLWQSLSIMADNLDGETCLIEADYQLDDEETWHPIPENPYGTSPQQEEDFAGTSESVNGKKLRYRLRIQTTDKAKTPKVNVVLIKALGKVDVKFSYSFSFRNIKYKADLTGEYEDLEPYELDAILDEWANSLATLRLNSAYKIFDNKKVFLDAVQTSVLQEKSEGYLGMITLTEI